MSFEINPINDDLISIKNRTAIGRSIRNLVLTVPGERFFNEDLGSRVSELLFDVMDDLSASAIRDEIAECIQKYEPRVTLKDVIVRPNFENNEFDVTVSYDIIGIDALPQQLNFALQSTR